MGETIRLRNSKIERRSQKNLTSHVLAMSRGMNVTGPKGANSIRQTKMRRNVQNSSLIQTHSQSSYINSNRPSVSASQAKVSRTHKSQSQLGLNKGVVRPSMLIANSNDNTTRLSYAQEKEVRFESGHRN